MAGNTHSPQPGERWLVKLLPVDAAPNKSREAVVKLVDYDPRTQTWSVEDEGGTSIAILSDRLIKKVG